jgi:hypothetical protein
MVEHINGSQATIFIGADNSTAIITNILAFNNTVAGVRWNCGYNDVGSTPYARTNWFAKNNLMESWPTKHDTFGTPNAARIGGWPVLYGVGFSGNFSPNVSGVPAAAAFLFEFMGLKSYQIAGTGQPPSGSTNVTGYVVFTNRTAWDGATGTTGGTYTLTASSPAKEMQHELVMPFDLAGTTRTATDAAGAYHSGSAFSKRPTFFFGQ